MQGGRSHGLLWAAARVGVGLALAVLPSVPAVAADARVDFARCLSKKDVAIYGADWCPVCERQLRIFGHGADYLDYVECSIAGTGFKKAACEEAGVSVFPTWEFRDGSRLTGLQSFATLSQKSGCPLGDLGTNHQRTPAGSAVAQP